MKDSEWVKHKKIPTGLRPNTKELMKEKVVITNKEPDKKWQFLIDIIRKIIDILMSLWKK